jgi:hypothetical protein
VLERLERIGFCDFDRRRYCGGWVVEQWRGGVG